MYNPSEVILNYLRTNCVDSFWIESAMSQINRMLATNRYFIGDVFEPTIKVKERHVAKFSCFGLAHFPNGKKVKVKLEYTFNPKINKAHSCSVKML